MKRLFSLYFVILLTLQISGQYIDLKQFKDAGIDINQSPPQDLLNIGIGNCDMELIKSAIAKGADLNKQFEGAGISSFPLCSAIGAASSLMLPPDYSIIAVSYTHLRAHETPEHLVCRLLLEKNKKKTINTQIYSYVPNSTLTRTTPVW